MPSSGNYNSPVAAIAGAFRSYKPNIKWTDIDPKLEGRINNLWSAYDASRAPQANANYLAAYAANQPAAQNIASGNLDFLNKYATQTFHPEDLYGNLLGQNQQALGNFLLNPALADLNRQRKETQARLGRTGGAGIYDTLLQGRLQQQLAQQAVPNLLGATNQAFTTAGGLRNQDLMNRLGLIGSGLQYGQLDMPASRYLEPQRLGRANLLADLANLAAVQKEQDTNRAYYRQPGLAERVSGALEDVHNSVYNTANQALDIYAKAYGGGLLGGGGGLGGGAGAGAGATSSPYSGYLGQGQWAGVPSSYRPGGPNSMPSSWFDRWNSAWQTPYGAQNPYLYPGTS